MTWCVLFRDDSADHTLPKMMRELSYRAWRVRIVSNESGVAHKLATKYERVRDIENAKVGDVVPG